MDNYDTIQLVNDATTFADSKFGQHYLVRLRKALKRHLDAAMDTKLSDSQRAHAATKAATVQSELEYFEIAKSVQETPSLLDRLRRKLRREEESDPIV